jgi:hypothetical protein
MPALYLQLLEQLRQWIDPDDKRHLTVFAEIIASMLLSSSASLHHWLPWLVHRKCSARSNMERLSYFVNNPRITASTFYEPLLKHFLTTFLASAVELTLDTSVLWDKFCLIEVCVVWGGRSLTLSQVVIEHGSATVSFEQYRPVLERAAALIPTGCSVSILADRGFLHGDFIRWAQQQGWGWCVRGKVDTLVRLASGRTKVAQSLIPSSGQAVIAHNVTIFENVPAHLAIANLPQAQEAWIVLADPAHRPSLQTFARYGRRFGGIEPHLKDYKSAAFKILDSKLRNAQALTCLVMLLDCASLLAVVLGTIAIHQNFQSQLDAHPRRGLSFLQLGLRVIKMWLYLGRVLLPLTPLPAENFPTAYASKRKQQELAERIEFSRVMTL